MKFTILLLMSLLVVNTHSDVSACSIFSFDSNSKKIVAKSYDWGFGHGSLTVNKRGVSKESLVLGDELKEGERLSSIKWVSKFGSVTFNQYGHEFPVGGMNEAGLIVEALVLADTHMAKREDLPAINELQWVQFQLDNYGNIDDVVNNINTLYIRTLLEGLHYFVCDRSGECATIEFLDEDVEIHKSKAAAMPYKVLTNDTYAEDLQYLGEFRGFGGEKDIPDSASTSPPARFVSLANQLVKNSCTDYEKRAYTSLARVKNKKDTYKTRWQIIYNMTDLKIHFRTKNLRRKRVISFSMLDFSCREPVQTFNLDSRSSAYDIYPELEDYSQSNNKRMVHKSLEEYEDYFSRDSLNRIVKYKGTTTCQ